MTLMRSMAWPCWPRLAALHPRAEEQGAPKWKRNGSFSCAVVAADAADALCLPSVAAFGAEPTMSFTGAQRIIGSVRSMLPRMITSGVVVNGEPILYCEPQQVPTVLTFLRDHSGTRCKQLTDMTAVDIPSRDKRFEVQCIRRWQARCCACTACCGGAGGARGQGGKAPADSKFPSGVHR